MLLLPAAVASVEPTKHVALPTPDRSLPLSTFSALGAIGKRPDMQLSLEISPPRLLAPLVLHLPTVLVEIHGLQVKTSTPNVERCPVALPVMPLKFIKLIASLLSLALKDPKQQLLA